MAQHVDPATSLRLGDFFAGFVATESASNGLSADDLAEWCPPARTARQRRQGHLSERASTYVGSPVVSE